MVAVPKNILIDLTPTGRGPSQAVPPYSLQYVFASDPPPNPLGPSAAHRTTVTLDVDDRPRVGAVSGNVKWTACEIADEGEVWLLHGLTATATTKPQPQPSGQPQTLASLRETFADTQRFIRTVVDEYKTQ